VALNRCGWEYCGVQREKDAIGKTDLDFFPRRRAAEYRKDDEAVMRGGKAIVNRIESAPVADGSPRLVMTSKLPLRNAQGEIIGIAGVMRDARSAGAIIGPYEDLKPAVDYLNGHFNESITIESVAAMVHLSTSQFQRRFRALFQTSPIQYLLQLRIDSACQQLQRTDASIGSIAMENGFYDQSAFCHQFQKRVGLTPRQYRTRFGKNAKWSPSSQ
jgi:AraC-like DNA-binding protein